MKGTTPVRTALLGFPTEVADRLRELIRRRMQVIIQRPDARDGLARLVALQPQCVMLYVGTDGTQTLQWARRVRHDVPESNLIIVCAEDDVSVTREAMRLGCRALAVLGDDEGDLVTVFDQMKHEEHSATDDGLVVALLGAKGGMGTTSLAINLAGALAQHPGRRVALIDLALYIGEVAVYLDMATPYALGELVRDIHRLDDAWIDQNIPRHRTGFYVLSQPAEVDDVDALTSGDVVQSLVALKRYFTHIMLDAGAQLSDVGLTGVHAADQTLVICTQELPSLVSTRRRVALLTQLQGDRTRTRIVVNRWNDNASYGREQIEKYIGHGVNGTVRNDYASMSGCIESGKLQTELAPDAEVTVDIANLIPLFDKSVSQREKSRKKLFGLF
ncbi:MAG: response regulator/pilus assembly protein [Proteobacteria bacterium]|nr:response regulator/pilus assembly protein [Pseudomonadota bacterium]